jgi:zinc/manganese transport system substrate-binding protein
VKRTIIVPILLFVLLGTLVPVRAATASVNIVTSTEDLAALTREIGGDKVKVESLARGYQDPHFVEPKPSFILKLHGADLLIAVGRELEIGWLPPLIQQSRNPKIQPGSEGYLDASLTVKILELPTGAITRAMGDVHPLGNPHYWLDPENGRKMAQAIQQKLASLSAGDAAYFAQRDADFEKRLTEAEKRWDAEMTPYKGLKIVTYHNSWPNFAEHYHLDVVGYVEPRPGIPPSPSHTFDLIQAMKKDNVKIILVEPYFDLKTPNAIARETGAKVLVMAPSVGGIDKIATYFDLFDYDIKTLAAGIKEVGAAPAGSSH